MSGEILQRGGISGNLTPMAIMVASTNGPTDGPILDSSGLISRAGLSGPAARKPETLALATVPTSAGATTDYLIVSEAGTLASVAFTSLAALAAHDTNYAAFTITNLGQSAAGTAVMLAATAANTTKITGGTALTAKAVRNLTLTGTAADLVVAAGDVLEVTITGNGTLANTITQPRLLLRLTGTT